MKKWTSPDGRYSFEFDGDLRRVRILHRSLSGLIGNVRVSNTDGKTFWIMGGALRDFLAHVLREVKQRELDAKTDADLIGGKLWP
jgi:hypothetical protein